MRDRTSAPPALSPTRIPRPSFGRPSRDGEANLRLRLLSLSVPLVLLTLTGCGAPSSTGPPDGQAMLELAFSSRPHCNQDILRIQVDGFGLRELTGGPWDDWGPSWSPDGERLVFSSSRVEGTNVGVFVMDSDGSDVTLLTDPSTWSGGAAWSPDGQHIAFRAKPAETSRFHLDIFVMRPDGSDVRRVTSFASGEGGKLSSNPRWAPDGERILFEVDTDFRKNGAFIYVANLRDGTVANLTPGEELNGGPAWSPDGRRIAFLRFQEGGLPGARDLFLMNADGSGVTRLTESRQLEEWQPSWSPNGRLLAYAAFVRDTGGAIQGTEIMIRDLASNTTRTLTGLGEDPRNSVWSPDGSRLAVSYVSGLEIVEVGGEWSVNRIWRTVHPDPFGAIGCGKIRPKPVWRPRR